MLRVKMTRATMIYAIIALVALSTLASANESTEKKEEEVNDENDTNNNNNGNDSNGKSSKGNLYSLDGYKFKMDEQLGHFKRLPFTNMYRNYMIAMKSEELKENEISKDANIWYRPDYATCYRFLDERINEDTLYVTDLLDFIVADACTAYVVDKVYLKDRVSAADRKAIKKFTRASKRFYKSRIDYFHKGKRSCIANLLKQKIHSVANHKTEECHHSLIQAFIQFAECSNYYFLTNRFDDNYVKLIYGLVRQETQYCFDKQLDIINHLIRKDFGDSWLVYFTEGKKLNGLKTWFDERTQQQIDRLWDLGLRKVLAAVENTKEAINLREVNRLLSHQQNGDKQLERRFLSNVADFATEQINPPVISEVDKQKGVKKGMFKIGKKVEKFNEALRDGSGADRYTDFVNQMCAPFRVNQDGYGPDYVKPLIRLVKLLDFPFTFKIDEGTFVKSVVTDDKETAPVYMAVIACHFLGLTKGFIRHRNGEPYYVVKWDNNAKSKMIVWPLARYV